MYVRTLPGPEKQPYLREFLDEPDTPLDIWVPPLVFSITLWWVVSGAIAYL